MSNVLDSVSVCLKIPAGVLRLQDVEQQLLDVAGGELVDVLGRQVSCTDLQLMFHGLDNPSGDPRCTHTHTHTHTHTVKHRIEHYTAHMGVITFFVQG